MHKKARLRRLALKRRNALPLEYREKAAQDLLCYIEQFASTFLIKGAVIAGYWAIGSELNPLPFLTALFERGAILCLPAVIDCHAMVFRSFDLYKTGSLYHARFGIREPSAANPELLPDIVLTPLVAFDKRGNRVGYGAGYYDRVYAEFVQKKHHSKAVGVGFVEQEVPQIPAEPFDQKMHALLTPAGLTICTR